MKRIERLFAGRHALPVAVLLAVLLCLPSLTSGLFLDDYRQRVTLLTDSGDNLFAFTHRGTPTTEAQIQSGELAWWTHESTKINFYRPVAEWLMRLDYQLWPDSFPAQHLHSLLWYALAVLLVGLAYRRLLPSAWAAGFAVVLFALDAGHGGAVAWLANRNALVGFSVAMLALMCFTQRAFWWQLLGTALFAFGLACYEGALALSGFLLAHELFLSERPLWQRALRLLPYALVAVAYLAFWKVNGYGTAGPGWYIDPSAEPAVFLHKLAFRLPSYLVGQFFLPPVEVMGLAETSPALPYFFAYVWLAVALLIWLLWPLLRASAQARFYALGMLIATVPISASIPVGRTLWFVGFGAIGLIALFAQQRRHLPATPRWHKSAGIFAGTMVVLHLWLAPALFVLFGKAGDVMDAQMDTRHVKLTNEGAPRKLLALSVPSYFGNITFPLVKDEALSLGAHPTRPKPSIEKMRVLVEAKQDFSLERVNADILIATSPKGFDTLRSEQYGFTIGDRVQLDDVEITVKAVSDAKAPTAIEYRFAPGALQSYEVIGWEGEGFVSASLPEVGMTQTVKGK